MLWYLSGKAEVTDTDLHSKRLTFDLQLHAAALAASLIAGLAVVQASIFDVGSTDFQSGHGVNEGHLEPITGTDL